MKLVGPPVSKKKLLLLLESPTTSVVGVVTDRVINGQIKGTGPAACRPN
jgi:hypothetical protein